MNQLRHSDRPRNPGRKLRPILENLEGRLLLWASSGDFWTKPIGIRFSIVPDGTDLGGVKSNLYAAFNAKFGANVWEPIIEDAASAWEYYANLNMTYVYDDGEPIGSGQYQQGNPSFGDIRIGGFVQSSSTAAFTIAPPPANGDSSSGDIMINTGVNFSIGGSGNSVDLETIMLHEFGHALAMAHSTTSTAVMYGTYNGVKPSLTLDDVQGIIAAWEPRQLDYFAKTYNNTIFQNSADITQYTNQWNQVILPSLDLTYQDTNTMTRINNSWFKVTTPANASSTFAAVVQSSYLSLLTAQVQIYDANAHLLAEGDSPINAYGVITGTQITNAKPNTTYYIRVAPQTNYSNADGAYALIVNMGNYDIGPVSPPNTVVGIQPSKGGGSTPETLKNAGKGQTVDPTYDFTHIGTLKARGDDLTLTPAQARKDSNVAIRYQQQHPAQKTWARHVVNMKHHSTKSV